jgi:hypothetical protein
MNAPQMSSVLRYDRLHEVEEPLESAAVSSEQNSKLNEIVTWCVLSICLAGWAAIGLFLWIPRVLRAVVTFSVALAYSTLTETGAEAAGRDLRSAANFYRRGFVAAVESIRPSPPRSDEAQEDAEGSSSSVFRLLAREGAWAIVVWYVIRWATGPVRGTPFDVAGMPWSDWWSAWVDAVWSVPGLFGA